MQDFNISLETGKTELVGTIVDYPVSFEEKNSEIYVYGVKGHTIANINEFNDFGRFQFEKDIDDAVRHFVCNIK